MTYQAIPAAIAAIVTTTPVSASGQGTFPLAAAGGLIHSTWVLVLVVVEVVVVVTVGVVVVVVEIDDEPGVVVV